MALSCSGLPAVSHKKNFPNNESFIEQACSVKMTGYWPHSCLFFKLWTSTQFWSINLQRRTFSNIQPSWLHIWSITYIYRLNLWVMQQELERHKTSLCAFELIYTWRILSVNSSLIWVCIFCFLLTLRKAFCVLIEINHSDTIFFICNRHMDNNEKEKRLAAMMENAK